MNPCPFIQITDTSRRPPAWEPRTATLCALPSEHGALHVMQSGRELRKWERTGMRWEPPYLVKRYKVSP